MTLNRSRKSALLCFAAFAAAGFISTGPVFADPVPAANATPVEAVQAPVEAVQTPAEVAPVASETAPQIAPAPAVKPAPAKPAVPELKPYRTVGQGEASYYGNELAGNRTANGERFNPNALTAAHRTLPMGTRVRVTNKSNGKTVVVRINDRGPFAKNRILDVSLAAAHKIGMVRAGKAMVTLDLVK